MRLYGYPDHQKKGHMYQEGGGGYGEGGVAAPCIGNVTWVVCEQCGSEIRPSTPSSPSRRGPTCIPACPGHAHTPLPPPRLLVGACARQLYHAHNQISICGTAALYHGKGPSTGT